ncbi:unnamed protein product [Symbiodinium necroappetens]|uniref:Uncharacterized protein n=1 Tax=Symbiodinium necroappetens TaxID=1628268 RepID=A0A812VGD7_9DINO|nr:unnamed protein product [Symbiodinium necroappetens]
MAALWDQHAELRNRALSGQRLMQAATGDSSSVLPSMENMSHNHLVLKEIVLKMGARQRLSSDPAERLAKMFLGWYTKYAAQFQQKPNFEATVWAFKDGWDAKVKDLWAVLLDVKKRQKAAAQAGGVPRQDAPPEDVYEEVEGLEGEDEHAEPSSGSIPGMGEGSSEAIDRSTMSREEKLAVDSAEAGYPLAHTLSESWGDEHMPKTPVEDAEVTESPEPHEPLEVPSLQTQRTLLDEELDGAASDACCVIDSSPEESSKPSALSRRPHISKSWNSALSPKLTKEQKDSAWACFHASSSCRWMWRVCSLRCCNVTNPDQEDTFVPADSPDIESVMEACEKAAAAMETALTASPVASKEPQEDEAVSAKEASGMSEMELEQPATPAVASKDDQMRLILEARKAKKAKAAQKAIAADAQVHDDHQVPNDGEQAVEPEAKPKKKQGPKPKTAKGNDLQAEPKKGPVPKRGRKPAAEANDPEAKPEKAPGSKRGPKPANDPEAKPEKAPVSKRGRKPAAEADDPEAKPEKAPPGCKLASEATDPEAKPEKALVSKRGRKPAAEADDPEAKPKKAPGSKQGSKPAAEANDPNTEPDKAAVSKQGCKPAAKANPKAKPEKAPVSKRGPKSKAESNDEASLAQQGPQANDEGPVQRGKPKAKGKCLKRPAARMQEIPIAEPPADNGVPPLEAELPKSFARRAIPTGAHGVNKYRRIVGAFNNDVLPKLKDGTKCAAEEATSEYVQTLLSQR